LASTEKKNEIESTRPLDNGVQLSKKKLSYKEQRELDALPARIEALETEQANIQQALADGSLYSTDAARAAQLLQRNQVIEEELMQSLERWTALAA
jgi:ATP-binding cassette subfamily F protein uup